MAAILDTQEDHVLKQIVHETLSQNNPSQQRADGVVQGVGPEFKPQFYKTIIIIIILITY
jgi:hypothetical protein